VHSFCDDDDQYAKDLAAQSMKTFFGPDKPYIQGRINAYEELIEAWGGIPDHLQADFGRWLRQSDEDHKKLAETLQRAQQTLELFGMSDRLGEKVRALNGGHRRRLEIARALLHGPSVLLLDEPTVGLDVATRRAITDHVHDLCARLGVAVLWATHLVDEVRGADSVAVLHRGSIVARGSADQVVAQAGAPDLATAFSRLTSVEPVAS
jgi:ABC-type glutathione transport system ATPase component